MVVYKDSSDGISLFDLARAKVRNIGNMVYVLCIDLFTGYVIMTTTTLSYKLSKEEYTNYCEYL